MWGRSQQQLFVHVNVFMAVHISILTSKELIVSSGYWALKSGLSETEIWINSRWRFGLVLLAVYNQMQLKTNCCGQEINQPGWRSCLTWLRGICCVKEEAIQNGAEDAAEIMQGDIQSSGIFCFATTKRISITFAWISGAVLGDCVCGWLCVYVKILFLDRDRAHRVSL